MCLGLKYILAVVVHNAMEKFGCVHVAIIDTWGRENWDFRHNISYFS